MAKATSGDATNMTAGSATATPNITESLVASILTAWDDNSITGKSVQAGIDQSAAGVASSASVPTTGNSSGPQNAAATSRRSRSEGQIVSAIVARHGHSNTSAKSTGAAACPAVSMK